MNILVTAAGGGVGQAILNSLARCNGHRVVAVDPYGSAAGLRFENVAQRYLVPLAADGGYSADILRICEVEKIGLIFPGSDPELLPLAHLRPMLLRDYDTEVMVGSPHAVALARDKLESMRYLNSSPCIAADTIPLLSYHDLFALDLPCVIKPRWGSNSVGVAVLHTPLDCTRWWAEYQQTERPAEMVVQEYLEGAEYTCTVLIGRGSRILDSLELWREPRLGPKLLTISRRSVDIPRLREAARQAALAFCKVTGDGGFDTMQGAVNVQARWDKNRGPVIFEVNPRFPGSTNICTGLGMNGPKMLAEHFGDEVPPWVISLEAHRIGWTVYRTLAEVYLPPEAESVSYVPYV